MPGTVGYLLLSSKTRGKRAERSAPVYAHGRRRIGDAFKLVDAARGGGAGQLATGRLHRVFGVVVGALGGGGQGQEKGWEGKEQFHAER